MRRAPRLGLPFQATGAGPTALAATAREWFDRGGTVLAASVHFEVCEVATEDPENRIGTVIGPPAFLANRVDAYQQLGVTDLFIRPGQDAETSVRTIEALVDQVLPGLSP
jgi:hypothetical protein